MSSTAHKKATKSENRSAEKKKFWAQSGFNHERAVKPQPSSWWTVAAAPGARDKFIDAAKTRAKDQWTTITHHLQVRGFE